MFCTACATHNPSTSNRCLVCGAALTWKEAAPKPAPRPRNRLFERLIFILPLLMVLLAAGFVVQRVQSERNAAANAYQRAEEALAAGDYEAAIADFADAGNHRDAVARRDATVAQLAPYQAAYLDGLAALDAGQYQEAVNQLLPVATDLPHYRNVSALLDEARRRWQDDLIRQADLAESQHDWLTAERVLAQASANDPANTDLPTRLALLRSQHAPFVYTWGGNLYLVGPDQADDQLVTSEVEASFPMWNPDRTKIAFYSFSPDDDTKSVSLYVVDVNGKNLKLLSEHVYIDGWPSWSPDGTKIAFASGDFDITEGYAPTKIEVVDVETGELTTISNEDDTPYATSATWSPTGDRIAFISRQPTRNQGDGPTYRQLGDVYVHNLATGVAIDVTHRRVSHADHVSWSPVDEHLLIYDIDRSTPWYEHGLTNIAVLDLTTGEIDRISNKAANMGMPFWSPDGSAFAFTEGDNTVHIRSLPKGDRWINLNQPVASYLSWSPDGSELLVPAGDGKQPSVLVSLNDGSSTLADFPIRFDNSPPQFGAPQWTPANPANPIQIVWPTSNSGKPG
jgi:Tol biopolymer transport system component